jgi:GAF domain-containing protein
MRIPITPQWAWLGECSEPQLIPDKEQLAQLPFSLPPIGEGQSPQAAMFVPITDNRPAGDEQAPPPVLGGIVLAASHPAAFTEQDLARIAVIAELVGSAIQRTRHKPIPQA